jgi:fatty acid desaturase
MMRRAIKPIRNLSRRSEFCVLRAMPVPLAVLFALVSLIALVALLTLIALLACVGFLFGFLVAIRLVGLLFVLFH